MRINKDCIPQEQIHHSHRCSVVLGCSEVKYTDTTCATAGLIKKMHHEYNYVGTRLCTRDWPHYYMHVYSMSTYKLNTFTSKPTSTTTDDQLEGISCFSFFDRLIRKSLRQKIYIYLYWTVVRDHI